MCVTAAPLQNVTASVGGGQLVAVVVTPVAQTKALNCVLCQGTCLVDLAVLFVGLSYLVDAIPACQLCCDSCDTDGRRIRLSSRSAHTYDTCQHSTSHASSS